MRKILLILLYFTSTTIMWGRDIVFSVDNAEYSAGTISKEDTIISHTFEFCNEGTDTVRIKRIEPSCLITVKEWSDYPIAPDMTGFITVELNCKELYGPFNKELYLYGNIPTIKLSINGKRNGTPGE